MALLQWYVCSQLLYPELMFANAAALALQEMEKVCVTPCLATGWRSRVVAPGLWLVVPWAPARGSQPARAAEPLRSPRLNGHWQRGWREKTELAEEFSHYGAQVPVVTHHLHDDQENVT